MQLLHTLLTVAYFSKVRILQFFPHKLTFSTAFLILFLYLFLLGFVTSTIWLPTEWHHPRVRTSVQRDRGVGFKQFCNVFSHISTAKFGVYAVCIFNKMLHKTDMPN